MTNKKALSMLGMARRAGKLAMGHDMAIKSIKENNAKLVVFASDISPRLVTEFDRACQQSNPPIQCLQVDESINNIHSILGYKAGVMTVNDINFATRIIQLLNQEEDVHGN